VILDRTPPWMTEERQALHETAYRFARREADTGLDRWRRQQHIDRDFFLKAGELGLLACAVPTEYGGGGGTHLDDFVVLDAFVRAGLAPAPFQMHCVVAPHYYVEYGNDEQRRKWLPGLASGQLLGALAMTEPDTGSDIQAIRARAERDGGGYLITGTKIFITNGAQADLVIVAASTDRGARGKGLSLFVLETKDCPGFEVGRSLEKLGQHESDTAELSFDHVRVPAANRLGEEGDGFAMLMGQLPMERLVVAITSQAAIEAGLDLTVKYVNERHAFGKPLIAQQHIRFEIADCLMRARVSGAFLDSCLAQLERAELDDVTAAMAKCWLSDEEWQILDRCTQLFGGYGYMAEQPIANYFINARIQKVYGGTNEIMREIIGRAATTRA